MDRGYTQYRFPDSDREEWVLFSAFIDYRLGDGSKLHILQDCAWCPNCGRFVIAEQIPSIESMEAEIKKFEDGDPELVAFWRFVSNDEPVSNRISELKKRIRWRITRKNPPRCLECGGFGVVSLPGGKEFLHPSTGERVIELSAGWTDAAPWWRHI